MRKCHLEQGIIGHIIPVNQVINDKIIDFKGQSQAEVLLEEESIDLMDKLRDLFEIYVTRFNELRAHQGDNTKTIKVFKISNTVNDFMLFRNSLKLIVARKSSDCISIGFLTNTGSFFSPKTANNLPNENNMHEIRAHIGPFNNVTWQFHGEKIDVQALVKHYITEFVRLSSR